MEIEIWVGQAEVDKSLNRHVEPVDRIMRAGFLVWMISPQMNSCGIHQLIDVPNVLVDLRRQDIGLLGDISDCCTTYPSIGNQLRCRFDNCDCKRMGVSRGLGHSRGADVAARGRADDTFRRRCEQTMIGVDLFASPR